MRPGPSANSRVPIRMVPVLSSEAVDEPDERGSLRLTLYDGRFPLQAREMSPLCMLCYLSDTSRQVILFPYCL
jgi:hypothetical protein